MEKQQKQCVSLHVLHTCTKLQQLRGNNKKNSSRNGTVPLMQEYTV